MPKKKLSAPAPDALPALVELQSLVRDGQYEDALKQMLSLWADRKSPELARVIVAVGERIAEKKPPVRPARGKTIQEFWVETAKGHDVTMFERLNASLIQTQSHDDLIARLHSLKGWPQDPRLTLAVLAYLHEKPLRSTARRIFYVPLLEMLERQKDPAALPLLREWASAKDAARSEIIEGIGRDAVKRVPDSLASLEHEHYSGLSVDESKLLTTLAEQLAAPTHHALKNTIDDLWARVYETPAELGPVQVLADALIEGGDPRGEYIQLQCQHEQALAQNAKARPSPREAELYRMYASDWMRELAPMIIKRDLAFQRGTIAHCALQSKWFYDKQRDESVMTSRAWRTVRSIEIPYVAQYKAIADWLVSDRFPLLRRVEGLDIGAWLSLCARSIEIPWDRVSVSATHQANADARLLAECAIMHASFPTLTQLAFHKEYSWMLAHELVEAVLASDRFPALETLSLPYNFRAPHNDWAWLTRWLTQDTKLKHVILVKPTDEAQLRLSKREGAIDLHAAARDLHCTDFAGKPNEFFRDPLAEQPAWFERMLATRTIQSLTITLNHKGYSHVDDWQRARSVIDRHLPASAVSMTIKK